MSADTKALIRKIEALPAERIAEGVGETWSVSGEPPGSSKPSAIKPVFATLEQSLVLRQLGTLNAEDQAALKQAIAEILG
jgi:hypothetical protein